MWQTQVINFEELVSYDKQNPDDPSKIGALSVLRKLSDHLGLALTDQEPRRQASFCLLSYSSGSDVGVTPPTGGVLLPSF